MHRKRFGPRTGCGRIELLAWPTVAAASAAWGGVGGMVVVLILFLKEGNGGSFGMGMVFG